MARRRPITGSVIRGGVLCFFVLAATVPWAADPTTVPDQLSSAVDFLEKHPGDPSGIRRVNALGEALATPSTSDPRDIHRLVRKAEKSVKIREADRRRALQDMSAATQEGWGTTAVALQRACRGADLELEVAVETPPDAVRRYLRGYCPTLASKAGPPAEVDVHRVAGFLAYARADMDSALKEWDLALPLAPQDTDLKLLTQTLRDQKIKDRKRSAVYQLLNQADRARAQGDTLRAMSLYRKILTVDPAHPVAREEIRRWETRQSLEKRQAALGAALRKAREEESAGRPEKARSYWLVVLQIDPLHSEARERLAAPRTVVSLPAVAPVLSPRQAEEFYSLGLVRYAAGDLTGARTAFAHCLKLNAQHPRAVKALARVREEENLHP